MTTSLSAQAAPMFRPRRHRTGARVTVVSDDETVRSLARALVRRVAELADPDAAGRRPLLDLTELGSAACSSRWCRPRTTC